MLSEREQVSRVSADLLFMCEPLRNHICGIIAGNSSCSTTRIASSDLSFNS